MNLGIRLRLLIGLFWLVPPVQAIAQLTCADLDGASVYSDEFSPVYLGFFGNQFAADSIMNSFGTYGSEFSALSVRNPFGNYGSDFGTYSANNDFTSTPPYIVKHDVIIARLTTNAFIAGGVSLAIIDANCTFFATLPSPMTPQYPVGLIASDGEPGGVVLTWPPAFGATSYEIFRNTTNQFDALGYLGSVTGLSALDNSAIPDVVYYYWIQACNSAGCTLALANPDTGFTIEDADGDGVTDGTDNCAQVWNPNQLDFDGDGEGDACDTDDDNDGVPDAEDDLPLDPSDYLDTDGDGVGDSSDAFPEDPSEALDTDGDGVGNNADLDDDNDGVPDALDDYPLGRFHDAPPDHWAFALIESLARSGITSGCGYENYCPDGLVTRAQMAVFLERAMKGSDFSPPAASGNVFLDVSANDFAASFIEQLAADGITGGCGNNSYCPGDSVTRAQMAVFLLRAMHGSAYLPPVPTGQFGDVDLSHWAVSWVEQLAIEGITSGCGNGNYCPDNPVTRAQMAVFLVRAFDL